MSMKGNPDAEQDTELIQSVIRQELLPVIKALIGRIEMLETENQKLKEITTSITDGFSEAYTTHRKGKLSESLDLGEDYDDINGIYKDFQGSDLKDDFINYILENDVSDDQIDEMKSLLMENARGKYGKYQPKVKPEDTAISIEAGPAAEVAPEAVGESPEAEKPAETGKKKSAADEVYDKIMSQHRSMRGNKV